MTLEEIDARISQQHDVSVKQQENYWYPWIAQCKCNYQAVARSREEGERYANSHLEAQRVLLGWNGVPQGHL